MRVRDLYNLFLSLVQEVEAEYCVANGHSHNAEVIYGDTDSGMVRFGPNELDKVMAMGTSTTFLPMPQF